MADMAQKALKEAQEAAEAAENAWLETNYAIAHLLNSEADRLVAKLKTLKVAGIKITSQKQTASGEAVADGWRIGTLYGRFSIYNIGSSGYVACGEYDNPAQVARVIDLLAAAVFSGKTEFIFPTVEELSKADFTFEVERFGGADTTPEDDGSNDDDDEENFNFDVTPAEDDDDGELIDPPEVVKPKTGFTFAAITRARTRIYASGNFSAVFKAASSIMKREQVKKWQLLKDGKIIITLNSTLGLKKFCREVMTLLTL